MMITYTINMAQVSTFQFNSLCFPSSLTSRKYYHQRRSFNVTCALLHSNGVHSRRLASATLLLLHCLYIPRDAVAATIFNKYMKRKKLDPLESYIPAVILAQLQIQELGELLEADKPVYAACRSLLRSGPAASLRVNIRAVAQYASDGDDGKSAFTNVDQCLSLTYCHLTFRALEDLDSQLLHASRNEPDISIESMKSEIGAAVNALDSLLDTVPTDILNKGKVIANAYQTQEEDATDNQDPELKQLESLL
ncbi:hypothetical protein LIER_14580 [Lithospermum erythrorhizon]|uniref:DUF7880 domain-containing protein n=1 Tax=Lithospermum erythrorhizon TaxID=34254 RepID=A0AAV3Q194_LITER